MSWERFGYKRPLKKGNAPAFFLSCYNITAVIPKRVAEGLKRISPKKPRVKSYFMDTLKRIAEMRASAR